MMNFDPLNKLLTRKVDWKRKRMKMLMKLFSVLQPTIDRPVQSGSARKVVKEAAGVVKLELISSKN